LTGVTDEDLERAIAGYRGRLLRASEVADIVGSISGIGKDAQFVYPSDHCVNHTNEGACDCAMTGRVLFERVRRGVYRVR